MQVTGVAKLKEILSVANSSFSEFKFYPSMAKCVIYAIHILLEAMTPDHFGNRNNELTSILDHLQEQGH